MRATWILIISWIIVSFAIWSLPEPVKNSVVPMLAYSTQNIIHGYVWTPITSIFVHADIVHLLMNSIAFVFFGLATEKEVGPKTMLMVFFIGAILGDIVSSLFYGINTLSIGASGGVSAVLGAAIFVAPFRFSMFPYVLPAPIIMVGVLYIITNLLGLFFDSLGSISYAAHIGGLAFGVGYGFSQVGTKKGLLISMLGFLLVILFGWVFTLI